MKKVLIINGHQYYDVVARGELTEKILEKATQFFTENREFITVSFDMTIEKLVRTKIYQIILSTIQ